MDWLQQPLRGPRAPLAGYHISLPGRAWSHMSHLQCQHPGVSYPAGATLTPAGIHTEIVGVLKTWGGKWSSLAFLEATKMQRQTATHPRR